MASQHYEKDFSKALLQLEQTGQATFTDFFRILCSFHPCYLHARAIAHPTA